MTTKTNPYTEAGAHFGYSRTRRHPSAAKHVLGTKDRTDIIDVEKATALLEKAVELAKAIVAKGGQVVYVGGKAEVSTIVKRAAEKIGMPVSAGRWVGGTLTNFKNIRGRIDRLEKLMSEREKGELAKYTKRERLMIDREIDELLIRFGGLVEMRSLPAALFVVDTRYEHTAVKEAVQLGIPVIGLSSTDGDFGLLSHPIPANDSSVKSVTFVVDAITSACATGKKTLADK
jgi:small subunit ribosomal protein S2